MRRRRNLLIAIVFTLQSGLSGAQAANHKPTLAQIEAAKKEELAKKKVADAAMQRLLKARGNLKQLTLLANQAQAPFSNCTKRASQGNCNCSESSCRLSRGRSRCRLYPPRNWKVGN